MFCLTKGGGRAEKPIPATGVDKAAERVPEGDEAEERILGGDEAVGRVPGSDQAEEKVPV